MKSVSHAYYVSCIGLNAELFFVPLLGHLCTGWSPSCSLLSSYIVSFSRSNTDDPESVIVWDTRTGAKKRGFAASDATDWPVLK